MNRESFAEANTQARFVAEARAAARISHASVVDIHDLGVSKQGVPYLVMELLRGETLEDVIDTRGPLAAGYACELFMQKGRCKDDHPPARLAPRAARPVPSPRRLVSNGPA